MNTKNKEGIWSIGLGALQLSSTNKRSRPEILGTRRKGKGMRENKSSRKKMNKVESTWVEKMNDEYEENENLKKKIDSETTPVKRDNKRIRLKGFRQHTD